MRSKPRFTRGTSVIAALILAALLGAIALGLHAMQSNSVNTAALPAQVAATTNQTPQTLTAQQVQAACAQAKNQALGKNASPSPPKTYPLNTNFTNQCIGAVLLPGKQPSQNLADYQCVGEQGTLTPNSDGTTGTLAVKPISGITVGKCNLQYCAPGGGQCKEAAPFGTTSSGSPTSSQSQVSCTTPGADQSTCTPTGTGTATSCPDGQVLYNGQCFQNPYGSSSPSPSPNNPYCTNGGTSYPSCSCASGMSLDAYGICQTTPATSPPAQGPCQNGQVMGANGVCGPSTTTPPPGATPPPNTTTQPPASTNNNSSNPLSSLLSGLAKGLLSPCSTQQQSQYVGGNGTTLVPVTTINPYTGQAQTTYVQQSTSQPYGTSQPCGAAQQQAPYGVGSNGAACQAPPAQPQCSTGATAQPISASGNGCVTSYQCVPLNGSTFSTTPTPQISCSPQIADVNESVAISYSCQNATGSSGGGFSTNNQLSGSASSTITAPPSGTNTANFGLTCTNNGQTASAQCSVQVNQPAIDLVADPQAVPSGQVSSIGWVTAGMQSCVISSPGDSTFTSANAGNQSVSGVAQTDAITSPTEFDLTCQSLGGQTKKASTTVTIGSATSTSPGSENLTVNSSVDGQSTNHGSTVTVTWQSSNAPSGSALSLWLIDVQTENAVALIAGDQPTSGSYQWQLPAAGASCDPNSIAPCASELVAGDSYGIEGALYTPSNAFLGGSPAPANAVNPSYNDYGYTPTPFTIGQ